MSKFTAEQPKDGETVLHCGHLHEFKGTWHWLKFTAPVQFVRPDGSTGLALWITICDPCYIEHGPNPKVLARGDGKWMGDDPIIKSHRSEA